MEVGEVEEAQTLGKRFMLNLEQPETSAKYREYLKEKLLNGEGETVVEIGTAIEHSSKNEKGKRNFFILSFC